MPPHRAVTVRERRPLAPNHSVKALSRPGKSRIRGSMKSIARLLPLLALAILIAFLLRWSARRGRAGVEVHHAAAHDVSPPLASLRGFESAPKELDCAKTELGCGTSLSRVPPGRDGSRPGKH